MEFLASSWVIKGGACGKNKHHSRKSSSHSRVDKLEASHLGSSSLWIILTKSISSVLPTLEIVSVTISLSCRTSSCYSVLVGMLNMWLSIMHVWLCKSACDMIYGHVCEMCWCKCCMQWKILNSAISLSTHNTFPSPFAWESSLHSPLTPYIILVDVLSVLHSKHMQEEWESDVSTLPTN